jgi:hypothetical protein
LTGERLGSELVLFWRAGAWMTNKAGEVLWMAVLLHPLTPLVVMSLLTAAALCASVWAGSAASTGLETVLGFGWALLVVLWMDADARRLRRLPCYDFGLLAGLYFPLSVVWYCLWSRGWRGLLLLLLLLALWWSPYIVAVAFWLAMQL